VRAARAAALAALLACGGCEAPAQPLGAAAAPAALPGTAAPAPPTAAVPSAALPSSAAPAAEPSATAAGPAASAPQAATAGLIADPRLPLVAASCTGCHSARLLAQHRGSRREWEERLVRMQKNHGLWELTPPLREAVLGYLAEHYAPLSVPGPLRRAPLPPHLLPPPLRSTGRAA
jgi:hypothetical protein